MPNERKSTVSVDADRMGRFIGQLRTHEGIPLHKLAHGLCSPAFLNRIENGKREVGKQMTDAFFQRLGKPVELFNRILDWGEFQRWTQRQDIITHLRRGETDDARSKINTYLTDDAEVLDQQFARIVEINCRYLENADAQELLPMVRDALLLTQPDFGDVSLDTMLLSQNEGRLLFAYLQLREKMEGFDAVTEDYRALLKYFKQPRYESRERVYLHPYVACRVIEGEYLKGHYSEALTICEDALDELTKEKRLYAYDCLLELKQKLYDAMGNPDRMPDKLLVQLKLILAYAPKRTELLIPCDEQGNVYCLNQVIRDRRKLLGISQEALAEGICDPRTLIRIENHGGNLHRKNRRALLQRVNLSGERYDYEVITDRYEDYLLRSELDRAIIARIWESAQSLLSDLRQKIPSTPVNQQYLAIKSTTIRNTLPEEDAERLSIEQSVCQLLDAVNLTLPLDLDRVDTLSHCILSVNETLCLMAIASRYKQKREYEKSLEILSFLYRCFRETGGNVLYYEDLYTRVAYNMSSVLNDLGRYREAMAVSEECIKLAIENSNSTGLTRYFYALSCNAHALIKEDNTMRLDAISMLKTAYAAALLSCDVVGQKFLENYSHRVYESTLQI